jgi:hypothetical protein
MTMSGEIEGLQEFADDLRALLAAAGISSIRALAKKAHYSHTALANAAKGDRLPSWEVTSAFVEGCNGDVDDWERRWRALFLAAKTGAQTMAAATAWSTQAVTDGADPEDSGSYVDARTVAAKKVALDSRRQVVGVIELRYSKKNHAAWGRFRGSDGLDHLATHRHRVVTEVEIYRQSDDRRLSYSIDEYPFDYQWCDLMVTNGELFRAGARLFFDGEAVAYGETVSVRLA